MNRNVDTFINVTKRREDILYRTLLRSSSSNIAFVSTTPLTTLSAINILDRSTSLPHNRAEDVDSQIYTDVKSFFSETENFLVTDIFTTATGISTTALYYKHVISTDNVSRVSDDDETLATGVKLLEVQILDYLLQPVEAPILEIDHDKGIVYSNFKSEYNSSIDYTVYYIKYTVRTSATGPVYTYVDLINQEPVYRLAEFDDLTESMALITDGRKIYLLDDVSGGYTITFPSIGTYAYLPSAKTRLQILPPASRTSDDPWYIRVTNGTFNDSVHEGTYRYRVAEYLIQAFTPEPTLKYSGREYSTILSRNLIKLDFEDIYLDSTEFFLYIEVNDADGNGLGAFTTETASVGTIAQNGKTYKKWEGINRTGIRSLDSKTGIVDIEGLPLRSTYEVISSYHYNEQHYEFTLVDFNPVSNHSILQYQTSLFIDPEQAGEQKTRTLYYLLTDKSGRVVESNWSSFDNTAKTISGDPLYYGEPPDDIVLGSYQNFIEDYSVEASGISATGTFLILGDVNVASPATLGSITSVDARRRGGGIIDTMLEDATEIQPELKWIWDSGGCWDGIPYPGNASYMIELPVDIMENAGGEFQASEIDDIVHKHTALGVFPVTKAYGVDVLVSGVEPRSTSITLRWTYKGYPFR